VSKPFSISPEARLAERAASEMGKLGGAASWAKRKANATPEQLATEQKAISVAGGKALWGKLTPQEKREKAVTMARARWQKRPDSKGGRPRKPSPPILLPQTSFKRRDQLAHIRLLTAVQFSKRIGQWLFQGEIYRPGALLQDPPANAVALECAGSAGKGLGTVWILWQRRGKDDWVELARSQARDRSWTGDLGPRAVSALNAKPALFSVVDRVNELVAQVIAFVDAKLDSEPDGVSLGVLLAVSDQLNGRIAQNDSEISRSRLFSA
jgi:hypothetical protein